jgi:hypothetical protein
MTAPLHSQRFILFRTLVLCVFFALCHASLHATPYATALTNSGSNISFRLNESADSVKVLSGNGALIRDLGALPAGVFATNLVVSGEFKIEVTKVSGLGYIQGTALQISSDSNNLLRFNSGRGVAVNNDPASPYFGRVYVANSASGSTTAGPRAVGDGIYVLNSDGTDALGQGNSALNGGLTFFSTGGDAANTPWHIEVGQDGRLYISDFSTNTGSIYVTDANVSTGSGANVLQGQGVPSRPTASTIHGRLGSSPLAFGSLEQGNLVLYALEGDISSSAAGTFKNGLRRWDVGAGPLPSSANPVNLSGSGLLLDIAGVNVDLERGPDGKFYLLQNRSAGNEPGIVVIDPNVDADANGLYDLVFNSLTATRALTGDPSSTDILFQSRSVKISPDGRFMAIVRDDSKTWIIPLINGIPDLVARKLLNTGSVTLGRDVSFDAAGNLYVLSSGTQLLRIYSPGLKSIATTGSSGTFFVTNTFPDTTSVSLRAIDTNIYERVSADVGKFEISRLGDTNNDLVVGYTVSGTARNGIDYEVLSGSATIPAGFYNVTNVVTAIDNAALDGDRVLTITLAPQNGYVVNSNANTATIRIQDDEVTPGIGLVFLDEFEANSQGEWILLFGSSTNIDDYSAEFAFDYGILGIPPAPGSTTTRGLRMTVNKNDSVQAVAAINAYPAFGEFQGNYALRFNMYMVVAATSSFTTEHALAGLNHTGRFVNRHNGIGSDGIWFGVNGDGSDNRAYGMYANYSTNTDGIPSNIVNVTSIPFEPIFTQPPYTFAGAPSGVWVDVEISQVDNLITWKINNTTIIQRTNVYGFTSGNIMLGYNDQFASIGSSQNAVIYDNVRVVVLPGTEVIQPRITQTRKVNNVIEIVFTAGAESPTRFTLESSTTLNGPFTTDSGSTIEAISETVFRATSPNTGNETRFYRIRR